MNICLRGRYLRIGGCFESVLAVNLTGPLNVRVIVGAGKLSSGDPFTKSFPMKDDLLGKSGMRQGVCTGLESPPTC